MMRDASETLLRRWVLAGLIDAVQENAIRRFEAGRSGVAVPSRLPLFALAGGGVMLMAGVFLFVAAHWDMLAPWSRFFVLVVVLGITHLAGVVVRQRHAALAAMLHGLGTAALGAGIFLTGQIFNLSGDLPGALLLWCVGALAAWLALRDWIQTAFLALLAPAWLVAQWYHLAPNAIDFSDAMLPAILLLQLDLVYLTAPASRAASEVGANARTLMVIGAIAMVPVSLYTLFIAPELHRSLFDPAQTPSLLAQGSAWLITFTAPAALAFGLGRRGEDLLALLLWALWTVVTACLCWGDRGQLGVYLAFATGAALYVVYGVRRQRAAMVNLGVAGFGLTLLVFYFSSLFDKLGRSAGLIGLGIVLVAVGVIGERARRRLVGAFDGAAA